MNIKHPTGPSLPQKTTPHAKTKALEGASTEQIKDTQGSEKTAATPTTQKGTATQKSLFTRIKEAIMSLFGFGPRNSVQTPAALPSGNHPQLEIQTSPHTGLTQNTHRAPLSESTETKNTVIASLSAQRSLAEIDTKWTGPAKALLASTFGEASLDTPNPLAGKSIGELKELAKNLNQMKTHLETKNAAHTAQKNNLSPEDTKKLQTSIKTTLHQLNTLSGAIKDQIQLEIIATAANTTAPLNDCLNALKTPELQNKSLATLKNMARELGELHSNLSAPNVDKLAKNLNLSPLETTVLKLEIEKTTKQVAAAQTMLHDASLVAMKTFAREVTAQAMTLAETVTPNSIPSKTVADLKTLKDTLQEAKTSFSPGSLSKLQHDHALTKEECGILKAQVEAALIALKPLDKAIANAAPEAMMQQIATCSFSDLLQLKAAAIHTDLSTLGCDSHAKQAIETALKGLQHMANTIGTTASDIDMPGEEKQTSASLGETFYSQMPKETRIAFGKLYEAGILSTNKESTAFIAQAGVHMRFFDTEQVAQAIVSGDYTALHHMGPGSGLGQMLGTRLNAFDTLTLKLSLHAAKTPEEKSIVLTKHGLAQTIGKLADAVTLVGKDGHETKIPTHQFKFDAKTVKVLLECAKPEDKKSFDMLFAYAMILQHKVDTGAPLEGPVSPEFAKDLNTVFGFMEAEEVSQLVERGFTNQSEVQKALDFMTRFAEKLGSRDDIQKTMMALIASPIDAIDQFEGTLYRAAINSGGMDLKQGASALQSSLATPTIGRGATVLQAKSRSLFEKVTDLGHTASVKLFDVKKGIGTMTDRLTRLAYDNDKMGKLLETISECENTLSYINKELGLPPLPLPKGIQIQHIRHVVNANIAREEVDLLTQTPLSEYSAPTDPKQLVSTEILHQKLTFATAPSKSLFTSQSAYMFKQEDMPTVLKSETKEGMVFLGLYKREQGEHGVEETCLGYLDPIRDQSFVRTYIQKANESIAHADNAKHSQEVRVQLSEPGSKEALLRRDVLTAQKQTLTGKLNTANEEKDAREEKINTLTQTESTDFKSARNAVRVALAEYIRDELNKVDRPEMNAKMGDILEAMQSELIDGMQLQASENHTNTSPEETPQTATAQTKGWQHTDTADMYQKIMDNPDTYPALTAIANKLNSYQGPDTAKGLMPLIQHEVRTFEGIASFGNWEKSYQVTGDTAKRDLANAENIRNSATYLRGQSLEMSHRLLEGLRGEGDSVQLRFGHSIDANTAVFTRSATATVTGSLVQASATGRTENTRDITLVKTNDGYQIQLSKHHLKEIGLEGIFVDIATVGFTAGGTSNVGYHLDFDSAEKAAEFLSGLVSGDKNMVGNQACLVSPPL